MKKQDDYDQVEQWEAADAKRENARERAVSAADHIIMECAAGDVNVLHLLTMQVARAFVIKAEIMANTAVLRDEIMRTKE